MAEDRLYELANLAIGSPEPGSVNFNALHSLLVAVIKRLKIEDVHTDITGEQIPSRATGEVVTAPTEGSKDTGGGAVAKIKTTQELEENENKTLGLLYQTIDSRILELEKQVDVLKCQQSQSEPLKTTKAGVEQIVTTPIEDMHEMDEAARHGEFKATNVGQPKSLLIETPRLEGQQVVTSAMKDIYKTNMAQPGSELMEKTMSEEQQLVASPVHEMNMIEASNCDVSKALALYQDLQQNVSFLKESSTAVESQLQTMVEQHRMEKEDRDKLLKELEFIQQRLSKLEKKLALYLSYPAIRAKIADTIGVKEQAPKQSPLCKPQEGPAGSLQATIQQGQYQVQPQSSSDSSNTTSEINEKSEEAMQKHGDVSEKNVDVPGKTERRDKKCDQAELQEVKIQICVGPSKHPAVAKAVPEMLNKMHVMKEDIQELRSPNEERNFQYQTVEPVFATTSETSAENSQGLRQLSIQTGELKAYVQDMEKGLKDMREKQDHVKTHIEQLVVNQFLQLKEQKADKDDVEDKISQAQFETSAKHLATMIQDLRSGVSEHEKECQSFMEKQSLETQNKFALIESDPFKENVEERLKALRKQVRKISLGYGTNGAAAVRTHLRTKVNCLSCNRTVKMTMPGPNLAALPYFHAWPVRRSSFLRKVNGMKLVSHYGDTSVPMNTRSCGGANTRSFPPYYRKMNILNPHPPGKNEPTTTAMLNQGEVDVLGYEEQSCRGLKDLQLNPIDLMVVPPQNSGNQTPVNGGSP